MSVNFRINGPGLKSFSDIRREKKIINNGKRIKNINSSIGKVKTIK